MEIFLGEMRNMFKTEFELLHKKLDRIEHSYYKQHTPPPNSGKKERVSPLRDKTSLEIMEEQCIRNIDKIVFAFDREVSECQKKERKDLSEREKQIESQEGFEVEEESEPKEGCKREEEKEILKECEKKMEEIGAGDCDKLVRAEVENEDNQTDEEMKIWEYGPIDFRGAMNPYYGDPYNIPSPTMSPNWFINNLKISHQIWSDWMSFISTSTNFHDYWSYKGDTRVNLRRWKVKLNEENIYDNYIFKNGVSYPFDPGVDLRTNHSQERGNDVISFRSSSPSTTDTLKEFIPAQEKLKEWSPN